MFSQSFKGQSLNNCNIVDIKKQNSIQAADQFFCRMQSAETDTIIFLTFLCYFHCCLFVGQSEIETILQIAE